MDAEIVHYHLQAITTYCEQHGLAPTTTAKKQRLLKLVLIAVPHPNQLTNPSIIKQVLDRLNTKTGKALTTNTLNTSKAELKWYYTHILKHPITDQLALVLKKQPSTTPGTIITPQDYQLLLKHAPTPLFRQALQVLYHTGLRPHELTSLKHKHLTVHDLPRSSTPLLPAQYMPVHVPAHNPRVPSQRNKTGQRVVFITEPALVRALAKKVAAGKPEDYVFPWNPRSLSVLFCKLKQRLRARGVEVSARLYDFRHTAATRLSKHALAPPLLHYLMGWPSTSAMPRTYLHYAEQDVHQVVQHLLHAPLGSPPSGWEGHALSQAQWLSLSPDFSDGHHPSSQNQAYIT